MARLVLNLLGSFEVRLDGQEITHFRSANVQGLLLYLCLQPDRPINRPILATLFWPDDLEKKGKNNLRKILPADENDEPFLLINRKTVQFNAASSFECDVYRFEGALATVSRSSPLSLHPVRKP